MSLDVSSNNLGGRIPVEIGGLSGLILLRLANNLIDGVIPPQIGHLGALEVLDLSDLKLQGSIPSALRSCTSLITLYVFLFPLTPFLLLCFFIDEQSAYCIALVLMNVKQLLPV
jgi:LRR receptor-like serine/threonine-protein kinase FLS2